MKNITRFIITLLIVSLSIVMLIFINNNIEKRIDTMGEQIETLSMLNNEQNKQFVENNLNVGKNKDDIKKIKNKIREEKYKILLLQKELFKDDIKKARDLLDSKGKGYLGLKYAEKGHIVFELDGDKEIVVEGNTIIYK